MAEKPDNATEMTIILAGKSGAGKSTLMGSLLEDLKICTRMSPKSVTEDFIKKHITTKHGVKISIIDTPGLNEQKKLKRMLLKNLSKFTEGKADLLLYCMLVAPGARFDDANPMIMEYLQNAFGKRSGTTASWSLPRATLP